MKFKNREKLSYRKEYQYAYRGQQIQDWCSQVAEVGLQQQLLAFHSIEQYSRDLPRSVRKEMWEIDRWTNIQSHVVILSTLGASYLHDLESPAICILFVTRMDLGSYKQNRSRIRWIHRSPPWRWAWSQWLLMYVITVQHNAFWTRINFVKACILTTHDSF